MWTIHNKFLSYLQHTCSYHQTLYEYCVNDGQRHCNVERHTLEPGLGVRLHKILMLGLPSWTAFISLNLSLLQLLICQTGSLSAGNLSSDRCANHGSYVGKCLPVVTTLPNAGPRCCYHRNDDGRKLATCLTVYEFPWNVFKTLSAISYLFYS